MMSHMKKYIRMIRNFFLDQKLRKMVVFAQVLIFLLMYGVIFDFQTRDHKAKVRYLKFKMDKMQNNFSKLKTKTQYIQYLNSTLLTDYLSIYEDLRPSAQIRLLRSISTRDYNDEKQYEQNINCLTCSEKQQKLKEYEFFSEHYIQSDEKNFFIIDLPISTKDAFHQSFNTLVDDGNYFSFFNSNVSLFYQYLDSYGIEFNLQQDKTIYFIQMTFQCHTGPNEEHFNNCQPNFFYFQFHKIEEDAILFMIYGIYVTAVIYHILYYMVDIGLFSFKIGNMLGILVQVVNLAFISFIIKNISTLNKISHFKGQILINSLNQYIGDKNQQDYLFICQVILFNFQIFELCTMNQQFYKIRKVYNFLVSIFRTVKGLFYTLLIIIIIGGGWSQIFYFAFKNDIKEFSDPQLSMVQFWCIDIYDLFKQYDDFHLSEYNDVTFFIQRVITFIGLFLLARGSLMLFFYIIIINSYMVSYDWVYEGENALQEEQNQFLDTIQTKLKTFQITYMPDQNVYNKSISKPLIIWQNAEEFQKYNDYYFKQEIAGKTINLQLFDTMQEVEQFIQHLLNLRPALIINSNQKLKMILTPKIMSCVKKYQVILDYLNELGARVPVLVYFPKDLDFVGTKLNSLKSRLQKSYKYLWITQSEGDIHKYIYKTNLIQDSIIEISPIKEYPDDDQSFNTENQDDEQNLLLD